MLNINCWLLPWVITVFTPILTIYFNLISAGKQLESELKAIKLLQEEMFANYRIFVLARWRAWLSVDIRVSWYAWSDFYISVPSSMLNYSIMTWSFIANNITDFITSFQRSSRWSEQSKARSSRIHLNFVIKVSEKEERNLFPNIQSVCTNWNYKYL